MLLPFACDDAVRKAQANASSSNFHHSGCPLLSLMPWVELSRSLRERPVILDVGTNKGYLVASLLATYCPSLGFDSSKLRHSLQAFADLSDVAACGACHECREKSEPHPLGAAATFSHTATDCPLQVYGFDGNRAMVDLQLRIRAAHGLEQHWTPQWLAVSSRPDMGSFPSAVTNTTNELGALAAGDDTSHRVAFDVYLERARNFSRGSSHRTKEEPIKLTFEEATWQIVNVTSIDAFTARLSSVPALVKIDTESEDAAVLDGAYRAFCETHVSAFVFEKSNFNVSAPTRFHSAPYRIHILNHGFGRTSLTFGLRLACNSLACSLDACSPWRDPGDAPMRTCSLPAAPVTLLCQSWISRPHRLRDHMRGFEGCGFACYVLSGHPNHRHVAKLTHGCWDGAWEALGWANVFCAHTETAPEVVDFFEARRMLPPRPPPERPPPVRPLPNVRPTTLSSSRVVRFPNLG